MIADFAQSKEIKLVMERTPSSHFRSCDAADACLENGVLESSLCFPKVVGVDVTPLQAGIDFVYRTFKFGDAEMKVLMGFGPYSVDNDRLWESKDFIGAVYMVHEHSARLEPRRAVDARGRTQDGTTGARSLQGPN